MVRKWGFIAMTAIILSYQNCSRTNFDQSGNIASSNNRASAPAANPVILQIEIPVFKGLLSVDLESQTVQKITGSNQSSQLNCLNTVDFEDLISYAENYSLCDEVQSGEYPNSGQEICTQLYRAPYVSLVFENLKLNLGEAFDGCGKGYKDFCGSKADEFANLIQAIIQKCK